MDSNYNTTFVAAIACFIKGPHMGVEDTFSYRVFFFLHKRLKSVHWDINSKRGHRNVNY